MTTGIMPLEQVRTRLLARRAELTALDRMAHGAYGVCTVCGEQISAARLAAVPHASNCQSCGQR